MDFEATYRQHVQAVFRFALSITRRRELAEDLTSEAFLALYRAGDAVDASRLPAWLLTVVRNRARDLWRHQLVEDRHNAEMQSHDGAVSSATPPLEEWILGCPELKPVHRACVMLRYIYGMTRAEIAAEVGLSETQVKGHLQYALTLLRKAHGLREA
jgi:RNA polymerase sigma-70 factor (ECF subfamily)